MYDDMLTKKGQKDVFQIPKQRDMTSKDVQAVKMMKDEHRRVITSEKVKERWKEYFTKLLNEENERRAREEQLDINQREVKEIRLYEVKDALKKMKNRKAVGPDNIPTEVWKYMGMAAVVFLTGLFNDILQSKRMPNEWRKSTLIPIFKGKGDVQVCANYRGIKLTSHTLKIWEKVIDRRLRQEITIGEQQFGFMPNRSTTYAIFTFRMIAEKYSERQRKLYCVFIDLEKAYSWVPREEVWYCLRKKEVSELCAMHTGHIPWVYNRSVMCSGENITL